MTYKLNQQHTLQTKVIEHLFNDTLPTEGFIRVVPLSKRLGIHHQTLRRWWKNDSFPKPQKRNGILLFNNAEVKAWINNQPMIIS